METIAAVLGISGAGTFVVPIVTGLIILAVLIAIGGVLFGDTF